MLAASVFTLATAIGAYFFSSVEWLPVEKALFNAATLWAIVIYSGALVSSSCIFFFASSILNADIFLFYWYASILSLSCSILYASACAANLSAAVIGLPLVA